MSDVTPSRLTQAREQKPMPLKFARALLEALSDERRRIGDSYADTRPDVAADHHAAAKALDLGARSLALVEQFATLSSFKNPAVIRNLIMRARDLLEGH